MFRFFVDSDSAERNDGRALAVSIEREDATIADLAVALSLPESALVIDGVVHLAEVRLSEVSLVEGSRVSPLGPRQATRSGIGRSWVGVAGGPHAGVVKRMDADGSVTIGRGSMNDLDIDNTSVSAVHAVVEKRSSGMTVTDHDSTNGTWVNGRPITKTTSLASGQPARIGSSIVEFIEIDSTDKPLATSVAHAETAGRVLFNRPPRGPVARAPDLVAVPEALPERENPTLRLVSLLVPILLAVVMVVALDSFRFALFALLSPLMVLGNWLSNRRTVKKERSGDVGNRRSALQKLRKELEHAERTERNRRSQRGPGLLEVRRRIELPSNRLWERRLDAPDALTMRLGMGTVQWSPTVTPQIDGSNDEDRDEELDEILSGVTTLDDVEVLTDLRVGPIGFTGHMGDARNAARSGVLQLATHHGPADLDITILTTSDNLEDWRWAQWLPHTTDSNGGLRIFTDDQHVDYVARLLENADERKRDTDAALNPAVLLVVDDLDALHRKSSPLRQLLERTEQNIFAMVIAPVRDQLPASIATVIHVDGVDGEFELTRPSDPAIHETGIIDGLSSEVASDIARSMARFEDPELESAGGALPARVTARDIFPESMFDDMASDAVTRRWILGTRGNELTMPIGISETGLFTVDLIDDGPHGLIAGTTGAGKSELLRTAVLGIATNHGPDDVVFVLIDYKGGSAFDACAALPHVVGVVTDLDDHLAERALQSLEAELHHRESMLRRASMADIGEYRASGSTDGPLPRLVVVIDEFATLRSELPEFVKSLVGIAQRGRSLGVHLILATQRPSGAVDANIRANTNLRIALRVQDASDSTDVIDDPRAARISRTAPGRAYVRRGDGDVAAVQTAYLSGSAESDGPAVRVGEILLGGSPPAFPLDPPGGEDTDLQQLVDTICRAAIDHDAPRRPWLEELPSHIADPEELRLLEAGDNAHVVLAVGDDPMQQRRVTRGWNLDDGNLAVIGKAGSGVTTALRSAITALGAAQNDRPLWVFPIDHGTGGLDGVDSFAHVSDLIAGTSEARQARLLQFLSTTLDERRAQQGNLGDLPLIVVAIDGCGPFGDANDVESGTANGELLARISRDGPMVGIYMIVGARSEQEIPRPMRRFFHQTIVLEQSNPRSYADLGISTKNLPTFVPGRALFDATPMVAQIIDWEWSARNGAVEVTTVTEPPSMDGLARDIGRSGLPAAKIDHDLTIPFGMSDNTRAAATLKLRTGEHCLIAGPSRSGRTNTLRVIASQLRDADRSLVLVGITPSFGSPLLSEGVFDAGGSPEDLEKVLQTSGEEERRWVILVDDADGFDLESGALYEIARKNPANVTIIAAARSSSLRQSYGHWTRFVRASGTGILLQPDPSLDGELLGVRLPRGQRFDDIAGRGYLVRSGNTEIVQVAH